MIDCIPISLRHGQYYHGQMALQTGILVAFTQIIPEHQVQVFGVLKARVKVSLLLEQVLHFMSRLTCSYARLSQ